MTDEKPKPYWLIREAGKTSGIMTVQLDEAITADKALEIASKKFIEDYGLYAPDNMEAVLCVLEYSDGDPVVTELTSPQGS